MGKPHGLSSRSTMFFAGLILLIPHRIGMSRVNYVIKRYNLPISRAGLLLYKYHNNIELSLLCGTLPGNLIVWALGGLFGGGGQPKWYVSILMIIFLFSMLISSIVMYKIYISGGDFGHLNAFYFSLIFLTLFDGFANAFAFAINAADSSMLSAGIPLSGLLVTLLHYVYKFFSDSFLWDDFDYYVLRLQLLCNIMFIFIALGLWSYDLYEENKSGGNLSQPPLEDLFGTDPNKKDHRRDFCPIFLLAISLGTVYAFYPSIAPYSIIDFQHASIIELWILIISALLPLLIAILDYFHWGPGGDVVFIPSYITGIQVQHSAISGASNKKHGQGFSCSDTTGSKHAYGTYIVTSGDQYKDGTNDVVDIPPGKPVLLRNWFNARKIENEKNPSTATTAPYTVSTSAWEPTGGFNWNYLWNCVWFCAIFYILCIQIFMSMLHYPDCSLSCFFKHPRRTVFISILFNTLRELMQAFGFAGAGKQCDNLGATEGDVTDTTTPSSLTYKASSLTSTDTSKFYIDKSKLSGTYTESSQTKQITGFTVDTGSATLTIKQPKSKEGVNGTIAATNKLITLFVMMFCVFTGDGYLQHYRRCCRDCWPTTGYNKYQSFFYWLRYGFKGGIKSITSSFTDLYYHNLRPQFISYA